MQIPGSEYVLSEQERNELCRRCGKRRGEHEGIHETQWCRGSGRMAVFRPSGVCQEPQGQLALGHGSPAGSEAA